MDKTAEAIRSKTIELLRVPIRRQVGDAIEQAMNNGKFKVKFYTDIVKTEDGLECPKLQWMIDEIKERGFKTELVLKEGYIYNDAYILIQW